MHESGNGSTGDLPPLLNNAEESDVDTKCHDSLAGTTSINDRVSPGVSDTSSTVSCNDRASPAVSDTSSTVSCSDPLSSEASVGVHCRDYSSSASSISESSGFHSAPSTGSVSPPAVSPNVQRRLS